MKKVFAILLVLSLTTSMSYLNANDGYEEERRLHSTSHCWTDEDGCAHVVTHHSILFGLITWDTEEVICP